MKSACLIEVYLIEDHAKLVGLGHIIVKDKKT